MAGRAQPGTRWRIAAWSVAAVVLLLPLLAMQVTDEVAWTPADFAAAGALIGAVGIAFEFALRRSASRACRAAAGLALATGFVLVWLTLAVGLLGSEDDPANLMQGGVLAVAIAGALIVRFRPAGLARAMAAAALAQALAAAVALAAGFGADALLVVAFAVPWLASAWLFRRAATAGS
jgi:hypothetical protein